MKQARQTKKERTNSSTRKGGKLKLLVELKYDADIMHGDDKEAINWFYKNVLKGELILHSNEIGDEVGKIKVIKIL